MNLILDTAKDDLDALLILDLYNKNRCSTARLQQSVEKYFKRFIKKYKWCRFNMYDIKKLGHYSTLSNENKKLL